MRLIQRGRSALAQLDTRAFAWKATRCPFCGPSLFVRLNDSDSGVRCVRCTASTVHLHMGWVLRDTIADLSICDVCELSARGPLVEYLRGHARSVAASEYFVDAVPGSSRDGIRCEDVQRLTYAEASFDLVTHTEIFEHVPEDARAFAELLRVLRPGGLSLFTVPLHEGEHTVERARIREGIIEHLHAPVHHVDPLRGGAGILAFRDYGQDILDRVLAAGFATATLVAPSRPVPWSAPRMVVVARKALENPAAG